jgi:hypothetical protein
MKKIRVQLQGGLGNQLFIWAMAHELERTTGCEVQIEYVRDKFQRIDRPIEVYRLFQHCDHAISINESRILGLVLRVLDKGIKHCKLLSKIYQKVLGIYDCQSSYEVPSFAGKKPRIIRGYFQNLEIVERNSSVILEELGAALELVSARILEEDTTVMHIRRGDTKAISESWGILSSDYYLKIVDQTKSILICSDDETTARLFVGEFPTATFLSPSNTSTWESLKILITGNQLVMANSTLSWWAGWLKAKKDPRLVFFPDPWRPQERISFEKLKLNYVNFRTAEFEE